MSVDPEGVSGSDSQERQEGQPAPDEQRGLGNAGLDAVEVEPPTENVNEFHETEASRAALREAFIRERTAVGHQQLADLETLARRITDFYDGLPDEFRGEDGLYDPIKDLAVNLHNGEKSATHEDLYEDPKYIAKLLKDRQLEIGGGSSTLDNVNKVLGVAREVSASVIDEVKRAAAIYDHNAQAMVSIELAFADISRQYEDAVKNTQTAPLVW